jgi:N-acyl homoserine lactone hydrolase
VPEYNIRPVPLCMGPRGQAYWTYRLNSVQLAGSCLYVWYIEGSQPKILVDAGATAEMYPGQGFPQENIQSLEDGLGKLGLKPNDIEIVILTHLHWDHIALAPRFTNAEFIVQKAELDFARNPHPASAMTGDYSSKIFNDLRLRVIEGDREIIDGVKLFLTPGHSPGGQSVAVKTPKGLAVITGFCCTLANFNPPRYIKEEGFPVVTTGLHLDIRQAYDSGLKVKQIADIILPLHECSFVDKDRIP